MPWHITFYGLVLLFTGLLALGIALFLLQLPVSKVKMIPLLLLSVGISIWCFGYGVALDVKDINTRILLGKIQYLGIPLVPLSMFFIVLQVTERRHWINRISVLFLSLLPALCMLFAWTNEWHHLIWKVYSIRLDKQSGIFLLHLEYGSFFWFYIAYVYLLLLVSLVLLIRYASTAPLPRNRQALIFLLSFFTPWAGNILYLFREPTFYRLDLTPFGFFVGILIILWGLYYYQLLGLLPVARIKVIESLRDGVLVVNVDGVVTEANRAAEQFASMWVDSWIKQPITSIIPELEEYWGTLSPNETVDLLIERKREKLHVSEQDSQKPAIDLSKLYLNVTLLPILGRYDETIGFVVVLYDITKQKQNEEALWRLATTDGLTGLLNRRTFYELSASLVSLASRNEQPLSVLMLDLDHFKQINDTYGHAVGDQVLVEVSTLISRLKRKSDLFARYGGEEFVILMPETSQKQACQASQRFLSAVRGKVFLAKKGQFHVSMSIGISSFSPELTTLESLLKASDDALYEAKRKGRDRAHVYTPSDSC